MKNQMNQQRNHKMDSKMIRSHVLFLCPSLGKNCGIARYTEYVANELRDHGIFSDIVNCTSDAKKFLKENKPTHYIVQHEYGLFDYLNPELGAGDTTYRMLESLSYARNLEHGVSTAIIMHTLVTQDHVLNTVNRQIFSSGIPVFHLNSEGAVRHGIPYLEHGILFMKGANLNQIATQSDSSTVSIEKRISGQPVIASFGFIAPNKIPSLVVDVCQRAGAAFIGSFAANDQSSVTDLINHTNNLRVTNNLHFDFADETEVLDRLSCAHFAMVFQHDIPHSATSGSIRFLFNLGVPILCNRTKQFDDVADAVTFVEGDNAHNIIQSMVRDPQLYKQATQRVVRFALKNRIIRVYQELLKKIAENPATVFTPYVDREGTPTAKLSGSLAFSQFTNESKDLFLACDRFTSLVKESNRFKPTQVYYGNIERGSIAKSIDEALINFALSGSGNSKDNCKNISNMLPKFLKKDVETIGDLAHSNAISQIDAFNALADITEPYSVQNGFDANFLIKTYRKCYLEAIFENDAYWSGDNPIRNLMLLLVAPRYAVLFILEKIWRLPIDTLIEYVLCHGIPPVPLLPRTQWLVKLMKITGNECGIELSECLPSNQLLARMNFFAEELCAASGDAFLYQAYLALTKREPDPEGIETYRRMLNNDNVSRLDVLKIIASSNEVKNIGVQLYLAPSMSVNVNTYGNILETRVSTARALLRLSNLTGYLTESEYLLSNRALRYQNRVVEISGPWNGEKVTNRSGTNNEIFDCGEPLVLGFPWIERLSQDGVDMLSIIKRLTLENTQQSGIESGNLSSQEVIIGDMNTFENKEIIIDNHEKDWHEFTNFLNEITRKFGAIHTVRFDENKMYRPMLINEVDERNRDISVRAVFVFDEDAYLSANPDVAESIRRGHFESGAQHYRTHGIFEGRPFR